MRQLNIDANAGASNPASVFMAEMDSADYQVNGTGSCSALAIEQGNSLGDRLEPVSFLHYVVGANEAGSETVNGVAANHYKFDESALGEQSQINRPARCGLHPAGDMLSNIC